MYGISDILGALKESGKTVKIIDSEENPEGKNDLQDFYDSYTKIRNYKGIQVTYDFKDKIHSSTSDGKTNPTMTFYYAGTSIKQMELWMYHGELHSYNDEPAIITYDENGNVVVKVWLKCNNFYDRGEDCNFVTYREKGIVYRWFENNRIFTAHIFDFQDNIMDIINDAIREYRFHQKHGLHRELPDGPAFLYISNNGKEKQRSYYVHGERVEFYESS